MQEGKIIRVGNEPMRLEVANKIDGVDFHECDQNRVVVVIDDLELRFIDRVSLIENKKSTPRLKDKLDVEELLKIK